VERTHKRGTERAREGERASLKGTIRESFGVSIGVLVQVDSCDSETHCPDCGGSEFLILNKTDLALHRPNGSEILAVAILGAIRFSSQIVKLGGLAQDDFSQRKYSICYIVDDGKKNQQKNLYIFVYYFNSGSRPDIAILFRFSFISFNLLALLYFFFYVCFL